MIPVIIPIKNSGDIVGRCLHSIVGQDRPASGMGVAERCGVRRGLRRLARVTRFVSGRVSLERGMMMIGLAMVLAGFVFTRYLLLKWIESGYTDLPVFDQDIAGLTLLVIGLETIFYSFFLSVIGEGK